MVWGQGRHGSQVGQWTDGKTWGQLVGSRGNRAGGQLLGSGGQIGTILLLRKPRKGGGEVKQRLTFAYHMVGRGLMIA